MKSEKSIASIALTMIILASFLLMRSPLVHGDYVVQNPSMPLDPTDFNATCAMKTLGNGQFYVPNLNVTALKVEFKFNDYLVADQTGGTPPYPNMTRWPDGTVDVYDAIFIAGVFGLSEGQSNWDYMADIIPDRVIDIFDAIKVSTHNGHTGSYDMNLTGVAVAFNLDWNPIPLSPGGYVQIPQGATSFIVCKGGLLYPTGAMVVFGTGTISAPYAYSSTFRFDIPSATSSDAGKTIRYYVMTRLYAPNPSGQEFYLTTSVGKSYENVQNVKLDGISKSGNLGSFNLGAIRGYHLLEFEFVDVCDVSGGGWLNFFVATQSGTNAWLARFRLYVPYYSDTEYRYTLTTSSWCAMGDDYFLTGYADDFIDDVHVDGLLWQDWEWDAGPNWGGIYAWGDGFCYPLSWRENNTGQNAYQIAFIYGEIWGSGVLDYQFLSWTNQRDKIGAPKFYTTADLTTADHITTNDALVHAGSKWKSESDPQNSERYYETRQSLNASYSDGGNWFNASLEVGLGLGWAEWSLLPATEDDVGLTLNVSLFQFSTNRNQQWPYWCELRLNEPTIDIYSFPSLEIEGVEYEQHDGFVGSNNAALIDYAGTVIMYASSVEGCPIGSLVGLGLKGYAAYLKITQGQSVSDFNVVTSQADHYQVVRNYDFGVYSPGLGEIESESDVLFFKLDPTAGKHCGLNKVVLRGTLQVEQWFMSVGTGPICVWSAPIGNMTIATYIPWFLRG